MNQTFIQRLEKETIQQLPPFGKELEKPCLIWNGYKDKGGYGRFTLNSKPIGAHVVSYMIANNFSLIPKYNRDGEILQVAHKCDVKDCVEPTHLYLATVAQNAEDRVKNGRTRGENHYNASITDEFAREIKLSKGNGSQKERSIRFSVPLSLIERIDSGSGWAHILDVDGNNLNEKRIAKNKKQQKKLKDKQWTQELFKKAEDKFCNPEYVVIDESHTHNGTHCLLWKKCILNGYPRVTLCGQTVWAHIIACTIGNNYIRPNGMHASHNCGQAHCVNSAHLSFKTPMDNMADKIIHKTNASKLSTEQIIEIRDRHANGESNKSIAKNYNVNPSYISNIIHNKRRKKG